MGNRGEYICNLGGYIYIYIILQAWFSQPKMEEVRVGFFERSETLEYVQ